ncbi:DUF4397 domain-containing protein [bacterium]|nr:DUF4397 domain-containing protein [bacterium]
MKRERILTLLLALIAMAALGLTGCSDDDDDGNPTDPGGAMDDAMLRVVHASPDAPGVDIYVNGDTQPVIMNLEYGDASSYLTVPAGDYTVEIRGHGSDPASAPAYTADVTLAEGATVTAVAAGLLSSTDADDTFRVLPLVEDFADPGAGNVAVRIVHAAADAPTVALDIANDGVPEVTDFARFAETGAAGVALPAGEALPIGVWAGDPLARASVFTTPELPAGANLFVIATGLLAGDPMDDGFSLLAIGPDGPVGFIRQDARAMVYALHASPDAPPVDIDAMGGEVVTNLAFGGLSGALELWPGAYGLDFRATGEASVAASATTPYLEPGMTYLAIASGFLGGEPAFQLIPVADGFDGMASDALVRVVHASPDAPTVDVGPLDADDKVDALADYTGLAFGAASPAAGTMLPLGALTVGVAATGTTDPVATFDLEATAGLRAFAVACGSLQGTGESFRLVLVIPGETWVTAEVMPN